MPTYSYRCLVCQDIRSIFRSISDTDCIECCGVEMARWVGKPPGVAIGIKDRAVKDKALYYGIKNIYTGEGITEHTRLDRPSGITVKDDD